MQPSVNEFYDSNYGRILSTGLLGRIQLHIHKILDRTVSRNYYEKILEVGAGDLEHYNNFSLSYSEYWASDIRILQEQQISTSISFEKKAVLKAAYADAQNLNFSENHFDLLVATCLLIHLPFPEKALTEWRRVTKDDGEIVIYVPCDPGLLIRLARLLFVLPKHMVNNSRNYQTLCAREHISSLHVLNVLIREIFKEDRIKIKRWPFRFLGWNLNLAYIYHIDLRKVNDSKKLIFDV